MTCCRLVLLLALAGIAFPVMAADVACQDALPESPRWFDRAQGYFSARACGPAIWFDRFFGDQREEEVASALVRIIPQAQYSDIGYDEYRVRFKASVNLPNLSERLSLVFDDDATADPELMPGETDHNVDGQGVSERASAAFRYLVRLGDASRADFDVGLRAKAKIFTRARYVKHWLPEAWLQLRYTQTFVFEDGPGWSESSLLEAEHPMEHGRLLRFSSSLSLSEEYDGLRLREGLQLMRQVNQDRAISYNAFAFLEEEPEWRDQGYSLSVRLRQRLYRPWFFVEVEPFLDWNRDYDFQTNPGIVLRTEFWFGDRSRADRGARKAARQDETKSPAAVDITSPSDVPVADPAASQ